MAANHRPSRPPLVLIANDQEWAVRSLESVLGPRGFATIRAFNGRQALELARAARPDAFILDHDMPDLGGVEVCQVLRSDPQVPLNCAIFITTAGGDTRAQRMDAYAAGAWEFCTQPLDMDVLLPKLRMFTQAKLAADRVRDESLIDSDTGLYNTRGLAQRAREIGADATRRSDSVACVAFCTEADAPLGDYAPEMATFVRDVCRRSARVSDAIGRLGPNEFAIVAPSTPSEGAARIVERLKESFAAQPAIVGGAERWLRLQATYAASPNMAESAIDPLELLYSATASLRQSRTSGGYTVERPALEAP